MLSLGHCRRILANEKQDSIATISMKKNQKHLISFVAHRSHSFTDSSPGIFVQSVTCSLLAGFSC